MTNTITAATAVVALSTATPALAQTLSPARMMTVARAATVCLVEQGHTTFEESFARERRVLNARGVSDQQLINLNELMTPERVGAFIDERGGCESVVRQVRASGAAIRARQARYEL